ncbi:MAG: fatty-acyl-CoA synthase [Planctomycetota bacterium]|jgi:fatty-acyl-CoA synthase
MLWGILERARALFGEEEAVAFRGVRRSYSELYERAGNLAGWLVEAGVRPGDRVAVLAKNEPAYLELYFAAARCGAVLCPLNVRLAPIELAGILVQSRPRLLFYGEALGQLAARSLVCLEEAGERLPRLVTLPGIELEEQTGAEVESLTQGRGNSEYERWVEQAAPVTDPFGLIAGDAVAQLYFTSGTTGQPKGVMLTHRNVWTHAMAAVAELGFDDSDRWGHVAPLFHLADAWACFAITWVGGTHLFQPDFEAKTVLQAFEEERVTATNLVPVMLQHLLDEARRCEVQTTSLRLMLSGGAPIAPAAVRRIVDTFACEYIQTYGMTETSPFLTLSRLNAVQKGCSRDEQDRWRAKTGRAFLGVELEVVDQSGVVVARDDKSVGEIRVRGETVSPGYWNNEGETMRAFRDGWLYTGDLAVMDEHAFVTIVDRKKDMILTGGENVYSTEVENALYEHPAILEAAVFGRKDDSWGERVCAAIVVIEGEALQADALREHCRERLAAYKCPREILFLDELPKTGSGKITKAALREMTD